MEFLHIVETPATTQILYASLWNRVLAFLIDCTILKICLLPFDVLLGTSFMGIGAGNQDREQLFLLVLFCIYSAILESSKYQATFGQRLVGILITDLDGSRIPFRRALLRSVTKLFLPLGCLAAIFTSDKQALHDIVADTQVIQGVL